MKALLNCCRLQSLAARQDAVLNRLQHIEYVVSCWQSTLRVRYRQLQILERISVIEESVASRDDNVRFWVSHQWMSNGNHRYACIAAIVAGSKPCSSINDSMQKDCLRCSIKTGNSSTKGRRGVFSICEGSEGLLREGETSASCLP